MAGVAVVTDSTSYLPAELVERHGIHVVPLYVVFGGDRTVPETDITDYDAFFEELRAAETCPPPRSPRSATSPPCTSRCWRTAARSCPSTSPAGCRARPSRRGARPRRSSARARAASACTCTTPPPPPAGLGLLVLAAAARAPPTGRPARRSVEPPRRGARTELRLWFSIDTLEFLRRGGRIGAASAWIGSTLRVKPILTVQNEMAPVERVRTSSRAFERMVDYQRQCHDSGADGWCAQHINAPEPHARLVERGREIFGARAHRGRARSAPCSPRTRVRGCSARAASRSASFPERSSSGGGRTIARCASRPRGRSSGSC